MWTRHYASIALQARCELGIPAKQNRRSRGARESVRKFHSRFLPPHVIWTCIANAFPITIRICALRGNILFLLRSPRWLTYAWLQHGFSAHTHESRSERDLRLVHKSCPRIRLSTRITIQNAPFLALLSKRVSKAWFETAVRSHGLKSGFEIRKGPNHVPKRLSECDSFSCEQAHCSVCTLQKCLVWEGTPHTLKREGGIVLQLKLLLALLFEKNHQIR